jgi:hypothetical protein
MKPTKNAEFALVIAERLPSGATNDPQGREWGNFLSTIRTSGKPPAKTKTLHENVWLIPLENGIPFLGKLIDWASTEPIRLNILFLDEEPGWIKYPPDASKPDEKTAA